MLRSDYLTQISSAFKTSRVIAMLGPRQCGKTTLAREYFNNHQGRSENYFDLENPSDLLRLKEPLIALEDLSGLIVIDEIQRLPELFPILRVLVDKGSNDTRYLILGSASRQLIRQSSESLAGRIHYMEVSPFSITEVENIQNLWSRGGFPLSYLADDDIGSAQWRKDYIKTFLEQDIPQLGINIPAMRLRRFWMMLAHYHGQMFNASEIGNALDLSNHTISHYLDILTGTFMVRQLNPWFENIAKRQVKTKKIYFRDSGILHTLLNINNYSELLVNPKIGASWEGFALESLIHYLKVDPEDCYFWATHSGAELDLLIIKGTERHGYEFKFSKTPELTKSMRIAYEELQLTSLTVIYPGDKTIRLSREISCIGLRDYTKIKPI